MEIANVLATPTRRQLCICHGINLDCKCCHKTVPTRVAQMTPAVCWTTCSGTCDKTYEKCALDNPSQLTQCRTAKETCNNLCSDQCGPKK